MLKCIITLICSANFILIYVEPAEVLQNLETDLLDAENKLAELSRNEALPITLFVLHLQVGITVAPPDDIVEAWIEDRKMIKGTTFSPLNVFPWNLHSHQTFYCPRPNDPNACLVPQEFNNGDKLNCSQEPFPFPALDPNVFCKRGTGNSVNYNICEDQGSVFFPMYGFCFENAKTLHTVHYILSPKLLKSNLLLRERKVSYDDGLIFNYNYDISNFEQIQKALNGETVQYKVQLLVPEDDMALGFWRKAVKVYWNAELQHTSLFHLWNRINEIVREQVIRRYESGFTCQIRTGVFDLELPTQMSQDPDQVDEQYNMWVKLIFCQSINVQQLRQGVVILMNNFINVEDPDPEVQMLQKRINNYCFSNRCVNNIKNAAARVRGKVRCCQFNSLNLQLFDLGDDVGLLNMPLLYISGLVEGN